MMSGDEGAARRHVAGIGAVTPDLDALIAEGLWEVLSRCLLEAQLGLLDSHDEIEAAAVAVGYLGLHTGGLSIEQIDEIMDRDMSIRIVAENGQMQVTFDFGDEGEDVVVQQP